MGLNVKGEVATLIGLAPTQELKDSAFMAGNDAIMADDAGGDQVTLVVNGISVEGGEVGVGAALADLDERPSLNSCQSAFVDTMQGRNVQFRTGSAVIQSVSAQLLDAVTGVAILCKDYNVEIGGHTDSRGSEGYNQDLSERRANSVRAYLIERNVPAEGLTALGYGESVPLDDSNTAAAYTMNRRTEFVVSER
jgi:outer membrane protein OmpA-like peptidoglycan-associated protein